MSPKSEVRSPKTRDSDDTHKDNGLSGVWQALSQHILRHPQQFMLGGVVGSNRLSDRWLLRFGRGPRRGHELSDPGNWAAGRRGNKSLRSKPAMPRSWMSAKAKGGGRASACQRALAAAPSPAAFSGAARRAANRFPLARAPPPLASHQRPVGVPLRSSYVVATFHLRSTYVLHPLHPSPHSASLTLLRGQPSTS